MTCYNSDDKTDRLMLNRQVISIIVSIWLLVAMTDISAAAAEPFNGILPPAAPGPYYVMPVMMPTSNFYQPQPNSMVPRNANQPIYPQRAPYYSNQGNRAARMPARDNTMIRNKPNGFTD